MNTILKFHRFHLLDNTYILLFIEIVECQPSSSYRASKSRFFPYIHCKRCRVCPTTKMASATVKPSIDSRVLILWVADFYFYQKPPRWRYLERQTIIQLSTFPRHDKKLNLKMSARLFNVETQFFRWATCF